MKSVIHLSYLDCAHQRQIDIPYCYVKRIRTRPCVPDFVQCAFGLLDGGVYIHTRVFWAGPPPKKIENWMESMLARGTETEGEEKIRKKPTKWKMFNRSQRLNTATAINCFRIVLKPIYQNLVKSTVFPCYGYSCNRHNLPLCNGNYYLKNG